MDINLLKNCEKFVRDTFARADKKLFYHNIEHIEHVTENVDTICSYMNISDDEKEIVLIAAWFHDIYYVISPNNHEHESANIAEKFLLSYNYPKEKIKKVKNCILATKIPQSPKNILEEILCDADLFHIGTDFFFERNEMYKNEITKQFNFTVTDKSFIENTINFFTSHRFFTTFSKKILLEKKEKNINILKNQLAKII